jgi:PRTRC genetic system ThiF family protein
MLNIQQGTLRMPEAWLSRTIRVLVVGAGGTGSEMIDALSRLHYTLRRLGHPHGLAITVQDGDTVSYANCARQRFIPADVGQNKATLLARRYGLAFGMTIRALPTMAGQRHVMQFNKFDLLITCVDRASLRVSIGKHWSRRKSDTLWLDTGNGRSTGQCVLGHLGIPEGHERLPNVYDLFASLATTDDDAEPSCSLEAALRQQQLFVNRWMADAAAALLARLLTEGVLKVHGAFFDMRALRLSPLAISPTEWQALGYAPCPTQHP